MSAREIGAYARVVVAHPGKGAGTDVSRTSFLRVSLGGSVAFDCTVAVKHSLVCGKTELGHQHGSLGCESIRVVFGTN